MSRVRRLKPAVIDILPRRGKHKRLMNNAKTFLRTHRFTDLRYNNDTALFPPPPMSEPATAEPAPPKPFGTTDYVIPAFSATVFNSATDMLE
jgi:hypothetical protein